MIHRRCAYSRLALSAWILCLSFSLNLGLSAEKLRIMGANISSGNGQNYDPGHGIRIFQGIKPDVVMIQEFNYGNNAVATIRGFVTSTFGSEYSYFRETGAQIPNGIISRYPILQSGEWTDPNVSNRDFSWARIDIPGNKDLWAVSVHFLTTGSAKRNAEAEALVAYIQTNVPASDYLVIGGDFNSDSRSESQFTTLTEVVNTSAPHPTDKNASQGTNASRAKPYDSVFADNDLRAYQVPVVIGNSSFTNGLVVDTRVYTPISEISPALTADSGAASMQHMAIVKDFLLPAVPPTITSTSPLPGGTVGTALSLSLTATGGTLPYAWTVTTGSLPGSLTLGNGGALTGTPSSAGTFTFTAKVTDNAGASATQSLTVTITLALTIPPSSLASAIVGETYSQNLAATGGTSPYTWSQLSGSFPVGLTLGNGGELQGTPTTTGTFSFTVRVNDSAGATATGNFSVTVKEPATDYLESHGIAEDALAQDSDDDGLANLVEYILGGDPNASDPSILPALTFDPETKDLTYTFSVPASTGSISWKVQSSTDLSEWTDVVAGTDEVTVTLTDAAGDRKNVSVSKPAEGVMLYFRLFVTAP